MAYNGITNQAKSSAAASSAQMAAKKIVTYALQNGETYPATLADAGISDTSTTYQYTSNSAGGNYCVSATTDNTTVHAGGFATNINTIVPGPCPGHTGTAPTTLADGSACPAGYIVVPGNSTFGTASFCLMKYEAKNVSSVATSQASGTPWVSISQTTALSTAAAACTGCHLMTEAEWMTVAANVLSVPSNWSTGTVGSGFIYSGHNDNSPANSLAASTSDSDGYSGTGNTAGSNQRRTLTLTNGEIIWDLAGNVYEWTQSTIAAGQQPGLSGESAFAWKQWNNPSLVWGALTSSSRPSVISATAATWTSAHGIGQLYSNTGDGSLRGFIRGGNWDAGSLAGVLALHLSSAPSSTVTFIGFRVAR